MSISAQNWKSTDLKLRPGSLIGYLCETTFLLQFFYPENREANTFHPAMLKEYCDESEDKSESTFFVCLMKSVPEFIEAKDGSVSVHKLKKNHDVNNSTTENQNPLNNTSLEWQEPWMTFSIRKWLEGYNLWLDFLAWATTAPGFRRCLVSNTLCSPKGNIHKRQLRTTVPCLYSLCLSVTWDNNKGSGTLQRGEWIVLQSVLGATGSTGSW